MRRLGLLALLLPVDSAGAESILPLISRWQNTHGLPVDPAAPSRPSASRRKLEVLTADNTKPIRIQLNFDSLYQDTAPEYTACFKVDDWFRLGLPQGSSTFPGTPPPNKTDGSLGDETCNADRRGTDCWGLCRQEDLIEPADRDNLIAAVTAILPEITELYSVRPVTGALKFATSAGSYQTTIVGKGWTPMTACASDCTMISSVAVNATKYCTDGVTADAVLSITKTPVITGVAGTGSFCAAERQDNLNRPTWLVFDWISSIQGFGQKTVDVIVTEQRALILHEITHALGFSNAMVSPPRTQASHLPTATATQRHLALLRAPLVPPRPRPHTS